MTGFDPPPRTDIGREGPPPRYEGYLPAGPVGYPIWKPALHVFVSGMALIAVAVSIIVAGHFGVLDLQHGFTPLVIMLILFGFVTMVCGVCLPFLYDLMRGRTTEADCAWFATTLADLLEMGIPLVVALERLRLDLKSRLSHRWTRIAAALDLMAHQVARGSDFATAALSTGIFPPHWSVMLRTGESTGRLVESLRLLGRYDPPPWMQVGRLIYATLVVFGAMNVGLFLVTYILPTFVSLFEGLAIPLPWTTRLFLTVFRALRSPAASLLSLPFTGIVIVVVVVAWTRPAPVAAWLPRVPLFGWLRQSELSGVLYAMASALRLGLSTSEALDVGALATRDATLQKALLQAAADTGATLPEGLARTPDLFPAPVRWLVEQGHRFGNLPEALEAAAESMAAQADRSRARAFLLVDLVLLVGVGLFVALLTVGCSAPLGDLLRMSEEVILP